MKKIITTLVVLALVISCKTTSNKKFDGGESITKAEGWQDENTYQLVVVGTWDRARYYIEGEETEEEGKEAASAIRLQQMAKTTAQTIAKRNFLEKVAGSMIKSKTGVEDGKLVGDVIQSEVAGKVPSPSAIVENYTPRNDVRITYQFQADGLKSLIEAQVEKIINSSANNEEAGL